MNNSDNRVNLLFTLRQTINQKVAMGNGNGEMEFSETLQKMAEYAKQLELLNMIRIILSFIRENQNLHFADLLRALARYTAIEYAKDEGMNPDWDVIGHLLKQAADKVERDVGGLTERPISMEIDVEEHFTNYYRHSLLLNMVMLWAQCLEREKYRFADILKILSEYALSESESMAESKMHWELAASIIHAAYEKARDGNIP